MRTAEDPGLGVGRPASIQLFGLLTLGFLFAARSVAVGENHPTFNRDIAPILFRDCAPCHRPGEAGPFSLLSFADARKRAPDLAEVTARRKMPPWLPNEGAEVFRDARWLSDAEIATFRAWAKAGAPEGRPEDLPPAPVFTKG